MRCLINISKSNIDIKFAVKQFTLLLFIVLHTTKHFNCFYTVYADLSLSLTLLQSCTSFFSHSVYCMFSHAIRFCLSTQPKLFYCIKQKRCGFKGGFHNPVFLFLYVRLDEVYEIQISTSGEIPQHTKSPGSCSHCKQ